MSDEEMDQLLVQVERELGAAWVEAVEWLQDQNQLEDVEARVMAGDYAGAVTGVEEAARRYAAAVHAGYITAGEAAAKWLDEQLPGNLVTFDAVNARAVRWAEANKLDLVREISTEQRQMVWNALVRSQEGSTNPLVWARDIRQSIGLTSYQEGHVVSYRRALETGDLRNALSRELRDGRYDRSLLAAIRDERAIPAPQIDRMVDGYRRGWVGYRSDVIARTEGLRAIHEGTEELFRQAIDGGVVAWERLIQQWNSHRDSHTRRSHYLMDQQKRRIGEPFESGDGVELMYPGDPNAPAAETAQCRCNRSMRLLTADAAAEMLQEAV